MLIVVGCSPLVVSCLLCVDGSLVLMGVVCCPLLFCVVHCWLMSLFVVCLCVVVCCLLFVVRCGVLSFVVVGCGCVVVVR